MIIRHMRHEYQDHKYRNLGWLVGEEVEVRPYNLTQGYYPDRVVVLNEYPDTILIEMQFKGGKYRRMISKAKMFCGDVYIKHRESDRVLTGDEVMISEQQEAWNCI